MSLSPDQKLAAYFLGRRIAGQRRKQERVPVAYLYNGVRLPNVPARDKATYPNELVTMSTLDSGETRFRFYCMRSSYPYIAANGSVILAGAPDPDKNLLVTSLITGESEWPDFKESSLIGSTKIANVLWSSVDIKDETGTVCFYSTEPVPVYE